MSFTLLMEAPIWLRGVIMRFMGRFLIDSSPVRVTQKGWAERRPERRRVVVPLLPQSSTPSGSLSPCIPFPKTSTRSPLFSMETPMRSKQEMVERQSAPWRNPSISVRPLAMAPNMTLRWEMDLSPGTVTSPRRP